MSRALADSFIDEEDLTCPLCVEEFDISDRNYRPCPCGYIICQFCLNNIRREGNGLCPACRRPYSDESIKYKDISAEDFKEDRQKQQRVKAQKKELEKKQREVEQLNRKHLAGLRVVQKNLVYVTGLNPSTREDELHNTLRGDQFFGQYGKIIKIVVSKSGKSTDYDRGMGVYVTFGRKEDAEKCIRAVNGSVNHGRTLRAQYGTTKYCSAYLRGETCQNKSCMFLHEPGEEADSFSRTELSSMNIAAATESQSRDPSKSSTSGPVVPIPSVPPVAQPVNATNIQLMKRTTSTHSTDTGDGSSTALPPTASWASAPANTSNRASPATVKNPLASTTSSTPSPRTASAAVATAKSAPTASVSSTSIIKPSKSPSKVQAVKHAPQPKRTTAKTATAPKKPDKASKSEIKPEQKLMEPDMWELILKSVCSPDFYFKFDPTKHMSTEEYNSHCEAPLMFDKYRKRRVAKDHDLPQSRNGIDLGPEHILKDRSGIAAALGQIGLSGGRGASGSLTGQSPTEVARGSTPQGLINPSLFAASSLSGGAGPGQQHQSGQGSLHQRTNSRFAFNNETAGATTVTLNANREHMAQQAQLLGQTHANPRANQQQQHQSALMAQFYQSNVNQVPVQQSHPAPPPGLKSAPTPPAGYAFGQSSLGALNGLQSHPQGHGKSSSQDILAQIMGGRIEKHAQAQALAQQHQQHMNDMTDASILHSRLGSQANVMQGFQGAGLGQGQQGAYLGQQPYYGGAGGRQW